MLLLLQLLLLTLALLSTGWVGHLQVVSNVVKKQLSTQSYMKQLTTKKQQDKVINIEKSNKLSKFILPF